jgi:cytochrome c oxidase subunit IV
MAHAKGHDDGAVHAHISPAWFYGVILVALFFLTALTFGQSFVDLGRLNIIIVIAIATTKASLVVSFFMHLKYDSKFNALVFISCIFFIGVFFAYTMNDTERRGEFDPDQNVKVLPKTGEAAPGGPLPHASGSAAGEHGAAPPGKDLGDHGGAPAAPPHH